MAIIRTKFQGVYNIIRFNWHYYFIVSILLLVLLFVQNYLPEMLKSVVIGVLILSIAIMFFSLIVSYYVYDVSDLYQLNWIVDLNQKRALNINAGFDETSQILKAKYPDCKLVVCDFYDETKHTEISIKRARKAYPQYEPTVSVIASKLPFEDNSFDCVFAILSAHEIRNESERNHFFSELNRILKPGAKIYVTEHLRDINNLIAFNIGFLHFHSKAIWLKCFKEANLTLIQELKNTAFISTFILQKNGNTP